MNIITRLGKYFYDGSKKYKFIGVNTWHFGKGVYTQEELDTEMGYMQYDNIGVVRILIAGNQANGSGNYRYRSGTSLLWREAQFEHLDLVLNRMRAHGLRAMLILSDEFNYGPDIEAYTGWSNSIHGTSYTGGNDFFTDENIKTWFKEWIYKLTNRVNTVDGIAYKDDPAIFAWELGNELRYTGGVESNGDTHDSARVLTLKGWQDEMVDYIKENDPNHMVTLGHTGQFVDFAAGGADGLHNGTTSYGVDYEYMSRDTNCDMYHFHLYSWGYESPFAMTAYSRWAGFSSTPSFRAWQVQLDQYINIAKANDKPVVIGEIGLPKASTNNVPMAQYPRDRLTKTVVDEFFQRDGDGIMFWYYGYLVGNNAAHHIYPAGPNAANLNLPELNSNDNRMRSVMAQKAMQIMGRRREVDKHVNGVEI